MGETVKACGKGLGADARLAIQHDLCNRIDRLARELPHINASTFACAVDNIGRIARDHDLRQLVAIIRDLENAMARSGGAAMVLPFLEAMGDAASPPLRG